MADHDEPVFDDDVAMDEVETSSEEPTREPGDRSTPFKRIHKRGGKQVRAWVDKMKEARKHGIEVEPTPLAQAAKSAIHDMLWEAKDDMGLWRYVFVVFLV